MEKGVLIFVAISLLIFPLVFAQNNTGYEKAYDCLKEKLGDNCADSNNVEQLSFSLLAMAYDSSVKSSCKKALLEQENNNNFGDIKQTALAILALEHINYDTEDSETWLLSQKKIAEDLEWFLQIEAQEETTCEINGEKTTIKEDKTITKGAGSCLTLAYNGYWLKIKDTCYNKNFTISCNKDFKTNLIYRKKSANSPYYISSDTHSGSAGDSTTEKINAFCLADSGCTYEGTLWATLSLKNTGNDVKEFLPYLIALKENNEKYLPSAFLYKLTDYPEFFSDLTAKQKSDNSWKQSNNEYYDTALALSALKDAEQAENAKDWLLTIQPESGCWHSNNIKDTAFILYAAWPKKAISDGGITIDDCEDAGYYCTSSAKCSDESILNNYVCSSLDVCCKVQPEEQTCSEQEGIECSANQDCNGGWIPASNTNYCCLGDSCVDKEEKSECEDNDYVCRIECKEDEEEKLYECEYSADKCCAPKEGGSYWWIWLLIILIILLVLAIIFRNQLRVWLFRIKNKFKKGPAPSAQKRPPYPPSSPGPIQRMIPRQIFPRQVRHPVPRRPTPGRAPQTKELDETLKKLKEMSK